MNGIINVLKPSGMSSHDVVSYIRRTLNIKKVGHTGTLDPNASGVLPICVGKATKITQYLIEKDKNYRAELTLGIQTSTQDKYGEVTNESLNSVTKNDIVEIFENFRGEISQIPPMFSAIKHKGKRLYELARENKTVERKSRKVTIHDIKIIDIYDNKRILFDVKCSKGTYIRTLCNDIGVKLNTFGYMSFLLRTDVSIFNINDAYTLEQIGTLANEGKISEIVIPMDYPLVNYKSINLDNKYYDLIINGGKINKSNIKQNINHISHNELVKVYCREEFIGIGKLMLHNDYPYLKMERVLR